MNENKIYELIGILTIILFIICIWYKNTAKTKYEYYIDGKLGESKKCYISKDNICYCKKGRTYIKVDNYYVAE